MPHDQHDQHDQPAHSRRDFLSMTSRSMLAAGLCGSAAAALAQDPAPAGSGVSQKARWAVVGLGQLALDEVLPAFAQTKHCQLVSVISGERDKAQRTAKQYALEEKNVFTYDEYDRLRGNDEIDIVYICLPNHLHAEYTIRAHRAGKHVLCEKPMAVTVEESQRMIDAARAANKKLMIAYRLRYEPFNQTVIDLARKQAYGKIKLISATNAQDVRAPNIRLQKSTGGGPLGDLGVYCLNAARYITGEEPIEVSAMAHQPADDPRFKEVDESFTFQLRFPSGVLAHCGCSFGTGEARHYRVLCAQGWIELDNAFAYGGQRLHVSDNRAIADVKLEPVNHFAAEMDHFSQCVLADKPPRTPGEEGLADMKVMASAMDAARSGKTVKV